MVRLDSYSRESEYIPGLPRVTVDYSAHLKRLRRIVNGKQLEDFLFGEK